MNKTEKIVLVGCGQHAKVVLYNIKCQKKYEVIGYFAFEENEVGSINNGLLALECFETGDINSFIDKYETNKFFIAFGNMKQRKRVYELFVENGWEAVNVIHPDAVVSEKSSLGKGLLIECGALISPEPIIGNNVVINTGSQVNHDNVINDHVYIASGVVLSGGVEIGENTLIDDGVIITLGKKVGSSSIIGAGSVVTKDIESGVIAYGNPCKVIEQNAKY